MEYVSLQNQQNTYPSIESYKKTAIDEISLIGVYPQNIFKFPLKKISDLKVVDGTSFKFILNIAKNAQSESLGLYTSPIFYTEMATSINESNPYFIDVAFTTEYIVNYYLDDINPFFEKTKSIESEKNISFNKNIFVLSDNSYDLEALVRYIDWVVSSPNFDEVEDGNVIPAINISDYTLPDVRLKEATPSNQAIELGEETRQVYEYKYLRRRNLDREPIAVREFANSSARELYRIQEDGLFIADRPNGGWFRVYDNQRKAVVGYISPQFSDRIVVNGGPFYVNIQVVKTNTTPQQTKDKPARPNPTIKNWKLRRKRDLDRNGMGVYKTPNLTFNRIGRVQQTLVRIIKEGETFRGYRLKDINGKNAIWAIQSNPDDTATEFAYQGPGDTVDPA